MVMTCTCLFMTKNYWKFSFKSIKILYRLLWRNCGPAPLIEIARFVELSDKGEGHFVNTNKHNRFNFVGYPALIGPFHIHEENFVELTMTLDADIKQ